MSLVQNIIDNNKDYFIQLCRQHYVKTLYAFGSAVTDSFNANSDIDFLYTIDLDKFIKWDMSDFDYADNLFSFEKALTLFFNRKIDLIPDISLTNQYFRQEVEKTKYQVYAA